MKKEKEDITKVIPSDNLKSILKIYNTLQAINKLKAKDYERVIYEGNKLIDSFVRLRDKGLIDDKFTDAMIEIIDTVVVQDNLIKLQKNGDYHLLSVIDTVFYNPKTKANQRKTKGGIKNFAFDFLLLALVAEIKQHTGKPNYKVIIEYLRNTKITNRFNDDADVYFAKRYERAKGIKPFIMEVIETFFSDTSKNLSLFQ